MQITINAWNYITTFCDVPFDSFWAILSESAIKSRHFCLFHCKMLKKQFSSCIRSQVSFFRTTTSWSIRLITVLWRRGSVDACRKPSNECLQIQRVENFCKISETIHRFQTFFLLSLALQELTKILRLNTLKLQKHVSFKFFTIFCQFLH